MACVKRTPTINSQNHREFSNFKFEQLHMSIRNKKSFLTSTMLIIVWVGRVENRYNRSDWRVSLIWMNVDGLFFACVWNGFRLGSHLEMHKPESLYWIFLFTTWQFYQEPALNKIQDSFLKIRHLDKIKFAGHRRHRCSVRPATQQRKNSSPKKHLIFCSVHPTSKQVSANTKQLIRTDHQNNIKLKKEKYPLLPSRHGYHKFNPLQ